jgi:hypothetical protein
MVERRHVTLSPDLARAWSFIGLTGVALFVAGIVDLFIGPPATPARAGSWTAFSSSFAETVHLLAVGLGLATASAIARGRRWRARAGAAVAAVLAVASLISSVVHALALPPASDALADSAIQLLRGARLRDAGFGLVYGAAFSFLGLAALRHLQRHEHIGIDS